MALTRISNDTLQDATITQPKLGTEFTTSIVMPSAAGPLVNLYPGVNIAIEYYFGTNSNSAIIIKFVGAPNPNIIVNQLVGATFTFTGANIGSIVAGSYIIGSNSASSFQPPDIYILSITLNPTEQTDVNDGGGSGQAVTLLQSSSVPTVDFSSAQVFTKTLTADTTINVTNPKVGLTKILVLTGGGATSTVGFTVGGAAGTFNLVGGAYDDTAGVKNFIQLICVNASEFWYSISQIA